MEYESLYGEIKRLSLEYLRDILRTDASEYGDYRVVEDELTFCPRKDAVIPADRVSEWSITKSGTGGKIRFFDKAAAIALARAIGVFDRAESDETEDLSEEALFGNPEEE